MNFNGSNGKGYSGVATYQHVSGIVLTTLTEQYPEFNRSKYRNQASSILIKSFSTTGSVIPNSRVEHAKNIRKCDYLKRNTYAHTISDDTIKKGDILMEIDGQRLGDEGQDLRMSFVNYYNAGIVRFIKCLKPEIAQVQYYMYIVDQYPPELEYVSADQSIELIVNYALMPTWTNKSTQLFNGTQITYYTASGAPEATKRSITFTVGDNSYTKEFYISSTYYFDTRIFNEPIYSDYLSGEIYYTNLIGLRVLRDYYITWESQKVLYGYYRALVEAIEKNQIIPLEQ